MTKQIEVAIIVFQGNDVLDFVGPFEVFSHAMRNRDPTNPDHIFSIQIIAADEILTSSKGLRVVRNLTLEEARSQLDRFEILVVPGGPVHVMAPMVEHHSAEMQFIRDFAFLDNPSKSDRIVLSVCTGTFLSVGAGVLQGKTATTHHRALDALRTICEATSSDTQIVQARYVDGGLLESGTRVITTGGISSGIDASFYVLKLKAGDEVARLVSAIMEYEPRSETAYHE